MSQEPLSMLSKEQIELLRLKYFDIVNDSAYVFDFENGRILDANANLISTLGYSSSI